MAVVPRRQRGLPLNHASPQLEALPHEIEGQEVRFARAFQLIRDGIAEHAFPGAALAVTYRGSVVSLQGFGQFTYEEDAPVVEPGTVFDLASITKVIATTAMAMLLYEHEVLDLDAPVQNILPEFVSLAPAHQRERRRQVTLRMLLAHSSGLPAYERLYQFAQTRHELIRAAFTTPLIADPGTRTDYSDIGFILLGEALERMAKMPLADFVQEHIFIPLRMEHTKFNPPEKERPAIPPTEDDRLFRNRIIQGEVNDENAFVMGGISGHAGLFAPAIDVAQFAECMLRCGSPILMPATIARFTMRETSPPRTSRALGWDTPSAPSSSGNRFSKSSFGHLGFTGTSLWIDPERRLSVTLLTNRTWPNRGAQAVRQLRPAVHDAIVEALEAK